jgi:hypothetical protein
MKKKDKRVRVIIFFDEKKDDTDDNEQQLWMKSISSNPAFISERLQPMILSRQIILSLHHRKL